VTYDTNVLIIFTATIISMQAITIQSYLLIILSCWLQTQTYCAYYVVSNKNMHADSGSRQKLLAENNLSKKYHDILWWRFICWLMISSMHSIAYFCVNKQSFVTLKQYETWSPTLRSKKCLKALAFISIDPRFAC